MRTQRTVGLVGGAAAFALLLSACGGGSSASGGQSASGGESGELSGSITFQTWNLKNDKYTPYFEGLVSDFEAANPGTEITWVDQPAEGYQDKLSADAAAGSLPDVVDMGPEAAYTLASAGVALDVAKADPGAEDLYLPKAWEAMTFQGIDGGTYGFPWYLNTGPSFYNGDLLDQCGLDSSTLPETYDELFDAAATFTQSCPDDTFLARTPVIEMFGEYGVQLMNEDHTEFTFNEPKGVELVQRFADLYQSKGLDEEALNKLQTDEVTDFKAGTLAYMSGSSYTLGDLKDTAPAIYDAVKIGPRINNASPNMYIESLVVNAKSKNQDLAIAFAKYVTDNANQLAFAKAANVFPSSAGTLDDEYYTKSDGTPESELIVKTAQTVKDATVWWPPEFSSADADYLKDQIAQALLGQKDVQAALDDTVDYANQRLGATGK
jgi:multiple sugar transport system substrate-binding protein